jgi:hypothetical protein
MLADKQSRPSRQIIFAVLRRVYWLVAGVKVVAEAENNQEKESIGSCRFAN